MIKEQQKRAVVIIGRFSPPTLGHYKVIDTAKIFIRRHQDLNLSSVILVIINGEKTGEDKDKNPLSPEDRLKFIKASGRANGVILFVANSAFDAFTLVRKNGYEPIAIAAGSDRGTKYIEILNQYFTSPDGSKIKHYLVPGLEREIPPTKDKTIMGNALASIKKGHKLDIAEVSGSLARYAVQLGYEPEFAKIVGLEDKPKLAKIMFNKIKQYV